MRGAKPFLAVVSSIFVFLILMNLNFVNAVVAAESKLSGEKILTAQTYNYTFSTEATNTPTITYGPWEPKLFTLSDGTWYSGVIHAYNSFAERDILFGAYHLSTSLNFDVRVAQEGSVNFTTTLTGSSKTWILNTTLSSSTDKFTISLKPYIQFGMYVNNAKFLIHGYNDTTALEKEKGAFQKERVGRGRCEELQVVDGFAEIISYTNIGNHFSQIVSYWEYAEEDSEYVEWKTDIVPDDYTSGNITFVWYGAHGNQTGSHDLYLNGKKILTFSSSAQKEDVLWKNASYELFFDYQDIKQLVPKSNFKDRLADEEWGEHKNYSMNESINGVYYLTVPTSELSLGEQQSLKVVGVKEGKGSKTWIVGPITIPGIPLIGHNDLGDAVIKICDWDWGHNYSMPVYWWYNWYSFPSDTVNNKTGFFVNFSKSVSVFNESLLKILKWVSDKFSLGIGWIIDIVYIFVDIKLRFNLDLKTQIQEIIKMRETTSGTFTGGISEKTQWYAFTDTDSSDEKDVSAFHSIGVTGTTYTTAILSPSIWSHVQAEISASLDLWVGYSDWSWGWWIFTISSKMIWDWLGLQPFTIPLVSGIGKNTASNIATIPLAASKTICFNPVTLANTLPNPMLSADTTSIEVGSAVNFDASSSTDADGDALWYYFDFGDGYSTGYIQTPITAHAYNARGDDTYTAKLYVWDGKEESSSTSTINIVVDDPYEYSPPTADLWVNKTSVNTTESIKFDASNSTVDPYWALGKYYCFDFGDGSNTGWITSSIINHSYMKRGIYEVILSVDDGICQWWGYSIPSVKVKIWVGVSEVPENSILVVVDDENINTDPICPRVAMETALRNTMYADLFIYWIVGDTNDDGVFDTTGRDGPSYSYMKEFDAVVWFTGVDYTSTLTSADQENIKQYLGGGGKLWLIGQDILYDLYGAGDHYFTTGLTGKYYDNKDLTNLKLTRNDATVNFDWGSGSPDPSVGSDTFSIRWTGWIRADYSETYTFYTLTDDGDRLWIYKDGWQLIIDEWADEVWGWEHSGSIYLEAGWHPIQMEYYENGGNAYAKLSWSSPSVSKQIIPSDHLAVATPSSPCFAYDCLHVYKVYNDYGTPDLITGSDECIYANNYFGYGISMPTQGLNSSYFVAEDVTVYGDFVIPSPPPATELFKSSYIGEEYINGISYWDPPSDARLVFFTFEFAAIENGWDREDLAYRVVSWLTGNLTASGNTFDTAYTTYDKAHTSCYFDATDRWDYFKVWVKAGMNLTANMDIVDNQNDFDLYLYNTTQNLVDYSISSTQDETVYTLADKTGYYYIYAYAYSGNGNFWLDVDITSDGNDWYTDATNVFSGDNVTQYLYQREDWSDWYKVYVNAGQAVIVNMTVEDETNDFGLYLYNSSLYWADGEWYGSQKSVGAVAEISEYYYIWAYCWEGNGKYTLNVWVGSPPPSDGNDESSSASGISLDTNLNASISSDLNKHFDRFDWYWIYLNSGEKIIAQTTGATNTDFDLYLFYNSSNYIDIYDWTQYLAYSLNSTSNEKVTTTVSETGYYYVLVYSYRGIGDYTLNITVQDLTPPTSYAQQVSPYWQNTLPFTVTAVASDARSGVKELALYYSFSTNNMTWSSWTKFSINDTTAPYEWSFNAPSGEGYYQFYTVAIDGANNIETKVLPDGEASVGYDKTPPTTTKEISGTYGNNQWYVSNVTFTLIGNDALSGVTVVKYRVNGGVWASYAGSLTFSIDGIYTVDYYSIDKAGNIETTNTTSFKLDKTAPSTASTLTPLLPDGLNGWYVSNVSLNLTGNDTRSGVNFTKYRINGGTWQNYVLNLTFFVDGEYTIEYYSVDHAGNTEDTEIVTFKIDKTKPSTISTIVPLEPDGLNYWYISNVTFSLDASDAMSGISLIKYRINNDTWLNYTYQVTFSSDGIYTIEYYAIDNASNNEDPKSVSFKIDKTSPITTTSLSGTVGNGNWYISNATVTLTGSDPTSDISKVKYRINSGTWSEYTAILAFSADGIYTVDYYSIDNAGNAEIIKSITLAIDKSEPSTIVSLVPSEPNGMNDWYITDVSLSLSPADETSGISSIRYRINNGIWIEYTSTIMFSADGVYVIEYYSVDAAGNIETINSTSFKIDKTPPTDLSILINDGQEYTNSNSVFLTLSAVDALSGISYMHLSNDCITWTEIPYVASRVWNLSAGDGLKYVYLKVSDDAGNIGDILYDAIILDTTAPVVIIANQSQTVYISSFTMGWYTYVTDIQYYDVSADSVNWVNIGNSTYHTFNLSKGDNTLYVRGVDHLGNIGEPSSVTITVVVKEAEKKPLIPGFEAVIIIVAISGVAFALKRRKQ